MQVFGHSCQVPVQMTLICGVSALRVAVPQDLRPAEARQSVYMAIEELERRFPAGLPKLDPIEVCMKRALLVLVKI